MKKVFVAFALVLAAGSYTATAFAAPVNMTVGKDDDKKGKKAKKTKKACSTEKSCSSTAKGGSCCSKKAETK